MEEQDEHSNQEQSVIDEEELERILPSLLQIGLHEFGLKYGEVFSGGELLSDSKSCWVVTGRKLKCAFINLDLPLLSLLLLGFHTKLKLERSLLNFFKLDCHFFVRSFSVDFIRLLKSCLIEELE